MKEENSNINIGTKGTLKVKYVEGNVKEITAELVEIKSKYFFKCYDVFGKPWYGHTEAPISDFTPFPNSDQEAKECDATAAQSIDKPLAQKNPIIEDITECYVPVSVEDWLKENESNNEILSVPAMSPRGLVHQMFVFDLKDNKHWKVLKKITLPYTVKDEVFNDETIDTVGKCANCGVEYHIHKESVKDDWKESVKEIFYASVSPERLINYIETNLIKP